MFGAAKNFSRLLIFCLVATGYAVSGEETGVDDGAGDAARAEVSFATLVITLPGNVPLEFVRIPPGEFDMGSPSDERSREVNENLHHVILSKGFWMGKTEVTQAQWKSIMGFSAAYFQGDQRPIEQINYDEVLAFLRHPRLLQAVGNLIPDLPTEAEWEYCCRAGTRTRYCFGDGLDCNDRTCDPCSLGDYSWYCGNSGARTHDVATRLPNPWGLYDMHGNLLEWCKDWFGPYPEGTVTDPTGPEGGTAKIMRGGYALFHYMPRDHRCAKRNTGAPGVRCWAIGFRMVLRDPEVTQE